MLGLILWANCKTEGSFKYLTNESLGIQKSHWRSWWLELALRVPCVEPGNLS